MNWKKLNRDDIEIIMNAFKKGYSNMAIVRRYGYSYNTITRYNRFYNVLISRDENKINELVLNTKDRISRKAVEWAVKNGYMPAPAAPVHLEIKEEPEPVRETPPENAQEIAPDYTLAGMAAIWENTNRLNAHLEALVKALDTMTNSIVIELGAINKGIDTLAERWQ